MNIIFKLIYNELRKFKILYPIAFKIRFLQLVISRKVVWGINNRITNSGRLQNVKFDVIGNDNVIKIGKCSKLSNVTLFIRGNGHSVIIGNNCDYTGGIIWIEDHGSELKIGDGTTIVSANFYLTEPWSRILVGKDCMFAYNIDFRTGDSHSIIDKNTKRRFNYSMDITIDDHVWIGTDVKILKGVHVESGSIVGSGAVLTSSIPQNCIAAGNPAKIIKYEIEWLRERIYDRD